MLALTRRNKKSRAEAILRHYKTFYGRNNKDLGSCIAGCAGSNPVARTKSN